MGVVTDILFQQDPGGFGNVILAVGKVGFGSGPRDNGVASLLSSSHGLCVNQAPLTITVKEI